ncbi:TctA family transporter [Deinobacterium chartae]|uniref:TctA family transporter n=1 Tax=Deinobacterium chartae TaxID=521158 RepID=A0A841HYP2_9DEIO|nr:hypothetical protein [Deinobacterium chartae]MBB6096895.1 TctA family transporter [Deinobacterium chartae]
MSSFAIYVIGFIIVIAGLAYGASLLNVPQQWIWVGIIVLAGIGIISAVGSTRRRDPSPREDATTAPPPSGYDRR